MEETTTTITAVKQEIRRRDWATQIEAQQSSGMTVQKLFSQPTGTILLPWKI